MPSGFSIQTGAVTISESNSARVKADYVTSVLYNLADSGEIEIVDNLTGGTSTLLTDWSFNVPQPALFDQTITASTGAVTIHYATLIG